jgi:AAA family ATP:ADP antiporter
VLNFVNSTGGYLVNRMLRSSTPEEVAMFNSGYLFTINLVGMVLQLFVVSRIIKSIGVRVALLVLPLIAVSGYALMATIPVLMVVRWVKTAENATDYSLQNTLRQVLFLPTTREEKYAAKQVIDSFIVRFGDMLSAGLVFLGTGVLTLGTRSFAAINVVMAIVWLALAWQVGRRYERLTSVTG